MHQHPRLLHIAALLCSGVIGVVAAVAAAAPASRAAPAAPATAASAPQFSGAFGIHVVSERVFDPRLLALTVRSSALTGPAKVRVLLPADYARRPGRRYPVLYLLHGTSGGAADWTTMGGAEQTTAGKPLIVVMPDIALDDDGGGWCTDWWGSGPHGRPAWETFHIDQLIPWIDHNLRTVRSRAGRAIAGLSQGGFCSMSYAARHPDLFSAALSFSGAPDIAYDAEAQALVSPIIKVTETALDHVPANSMFGPRLSNEINWAAHDPTTLAGNLRDVELTMFTGDGKAGPFDTRPANAEALAIEAGVEQLTKLFHNRLAQLGIPSFYDDYGPGSHTWPYWARDLRLSINRIMAGFAHPPSPPAQVSYTSADPGYSVFGWQVAIRRKVREFSTLAQAGRDGFVLMGSGAATVLTPPGYRPTGRYAVTIDSRDGTATRIEPADSRGRLTITLTLGPSDTVQEYPQDGPPTGTTVYTTRVRIARSLRAS